MVHLVQCLAVAALVLVVSSACESERPAVTPTTVPIYTNAPAPALQATVATGQPLALTIPANYGTGYTVVLHVASTTAAAGALVELRTPGGDLLANDAGAVTRGRIELDGAALTAALQGASGPLLAEFVTPDAGAWTLWADAAPGVTLRPTIIVYH